MKHIAIPKELRKAGQYALPVVGNCLYSPLSPLKVADGDIVVCRDLVVNTYADLLCVGNDVVVVYLRDGWRGVKVLSGFDCLTGTLHLSFYLPRPTTMQIPFNAVLRVAVVDAVLHDGVWNEKRAHPHEQTR